MNTQIAGFRAFKFSPNHLISEKITGRKAIAAVAMHAGV